MLAITTSSSHLPPAGLLLPSMGVSSANDMMMNDVVHVSLMPPSSSGAGQSPLIPASFAAPMRHQHQTLLPSFIGPRGGVTDTAATTTLSDLVSPNNSYDTAMMPRLLNDTSRTSHDSALLQAYPRHTIYTTTAASVNGGRAASNVPPLPSFITVPLGGFLTSHVASASLAEHAASNEME